MFALLTTTTQSGESVLLKHISASLWRLLLGFGSGAAAGLLLGLAMGSSKLANACFGPVISVLMPVPGITWAPILVLVLGFGNPTLITVTFIATVFPVVYNTAAGVRSIRKDLLWAARTMGAGRRSLYLRVLLPSSAPYILTGLKLGLARGWRTLIAVEMIASALWGLGYMIFDAKEYIRTDIIYAGIIIMAVIYALMERTAFGLVEKRTVEKWGMVRDVA
jgi:ABC-type nitrate/sulfonate/bicarbonate transport system permease component